MNAEHALLIQQAETRIRNDYEATIAALRREEERLKAECENLKKNKRDTDTTTANLRKDL